MSSEQQPSFHEEDLRQLIDAVVDECTDRSQREHLDKMLAENLAAFDFYVEYMTLHADLHWLRRGAVDVARQVTRQRRSSGNALRVIGGVTVVAAAILLAFMRPAQERSDRTRDDSDSGTEVAAMHWSRNWDISPTTDADYTELAPNRIRLDHGELFVASTAPSSREAGLGADLHIETREGTVSTDRAIFYIGTYTTSDDSDSTSEEQAMNTTLTRVLIVAGTLALSNSQGTVTGREREVLAAERNQPPTKLAVESNADFGIALYHQLAREHGDDNLFFSPYSISNAMLILAEGARGKTAEEIGQVMQLPASVRRLGSGQQRIPWEVSLLHTGVAEVNRQLTEIKSSPEQERLREKIAGLKVQLAAANALVVVTQSRNAMRRADKIADEINDLTKQLKDYDVRVANALWADQAYPIAKEYVQTIDNAYNTGGIYPVDFRNDFAAAREQINRWCRENTNGRIPEIFPEMPAERAAMLRLAVTNAIYFKANWKSPFKVSRTRDRDFTLADGTTIKAAIMSSRLDVGRYGAFNSDGSFFATPDKIRVGQKEGLYPDDNGFAVVELPYRGDDLAMIVMAPTVADGLPTLEKKLTADRLSRWINQLKAREFSLRLPKLKFDTTYALNDTLSKMGMPTAFIAPNDRTEGADFRGITVSPEQQLYLDTFRHKAFVEINEAGTEAAAATIAAATDGEAAPVEWIPFTPRFYADRPFLFVIRHQSTGAILFIGRITSPN